jgi:hypothetical protein
MAQFTWLRDEVRSKKKNTTPGKMLFGKTVFANPDACCSSYN